MSNNNSYNSNKQNNLAAALQRLEGPGERVKAGLGKAVQALQKINLGKLIDDMEKDQGLADRLEMLNCEVQDEAERKAIVQQALAACRAEIQDHLSQFLFFHPDATYEEWIQDLHPENVAQGQLLTDLSSVDMRFYVADSDHRLIWNAQMADNGDPSRQVAARSYKPAPGEHVPLDLLSNNNDSYSNIDNDNNNGNDRHSLAAHEEEQGNPPSADHEPSYDNNDNNKNGANVDNQQLFDFLS